MVKIPNSQEDTETVNHSSEYTIFDVSNHTFWSIYFKVWLFYET